jgi:hypothetical protein
VADELAFLYLEHDGDVNVALGLTQRPSNASVAADALVWAYYKLGSTESAVVANLKDAVQMMPNNATYKYHLGMAYLGGWSSSPSPRSLQTALKDNPNFIYAASARAGLNEIAKRAH